MFDISQYLIPLLRIQEARGSNLAPRDLCIGVGRILARSSCIYKNTVVFMNDINLF